MRPAERMPVTYFKISKTILLNFNTVVQSAKMKLLSREALLKNININRVNTLNIKLIE